KTPQPEGKPGTVLYAPTWEGGQSTVAYGSLPSHGPALVESLRRAGLRVIYRPHPLTGVRDPAYGDADARLRELLAGDENLISEGRELMTDFDLADLLICDVSAVANDWLVTGRTLLITRTSSRETGEAGTRLLQVAPRLTVADSSQAGAIAVEHITQDPQRAERAALVEYYLGDI